MKKLGCLMMALLTAGALMTGCGQSKAPTEGGEAGDATAEATAQIAANDEAAAATETAQDEESQGQLEVYTSFYPLYDFATKVGGDKVKVVNLVPAGVEPHDYEPSAKEVAALENADVFIYNGAGMESWTDKVLASLQNKDLKVVEASQNIDLLKGHAHEHEEEGEHEEAEEEHDENGFDPHVWISIKNAKVEMENIKNALEEADPDHKDYYEANYIEYAKKFDALDEKYKETLTPFENRDIIVAHEAFAYLCKDYDLNQVGIEGISADSEPDPARMAEIVDFAKEHQMKVIFFEELVSPKVAKAIAKEVGAEAMVLNPLEGLTEEQISAGEDYLSVMEQNLEALTKALQ